MLPSTPSLFTLICRLKSAQTAGRKTYPVIVHDQQAERALEREQYVPVKHVGIAKTNAILLPKTMRTFAETKEINKKQVS
jgi:hypothetical protein